MLLVLFLLVALWQGTAPSMARSDESTASTAPRTLIQNAGLLITTGDSIVAVRKGLSAADDERHLLKRLHEDLIRPNPLATLQLAGTPGMQNFTSLMEAAQLAREWDVKLNEHLLEHIKQQDSEPIQSLRQSGASDLRGNLLVNHAIHLTDEEIILLAKHDVRIAHNPLSTTNDTSDMFNDMRAAVGLLRAKTLRADIYPAVRRPWTLTTTSALSHPARKQIS